MYSTSIEMLRIGNLKVKFSLILLGDDDPKKKTSNQLVSKLRKGENQYLKFLSRGRIVLEYVTESWDSSNQIGFTRSYFYPFLRKLKLFTRDFQIPNLFGYGLGNRLIVNPELAKTKEMTVTTTNRACTFTYAVVRDQENQEVEYEGCVMFINQRSNALTLTYDELCTLVEVLDRVDFDLLSMQLIQAAKLYENMSAKEFGSEPYIISQNQTMGQTIYRGPSLIEKPKLFP